MDTSSRTEEKTPSSGIETADWLLLLVGYLTLNVLYHTAPHLLCRFEVKDMQGLQCFA